MLFTYLCASTNSVSILISQQFGNKDKEKDDGKTTSLVGENNVNSIIASICKKFIVIIPSGQQGYNTFDQIVYFSPWITTC